MQPRPECTKRMSLAVGGKKTKTCKWYLLHDFHSLAIFKKFISVFSLFSVCQSCSAVGMETMILISPTAAGPVREKQFMLTRLKSSSKLRVRAEGAAGIHLPNRGSSSRRYPSPLRLLGPAAAGVRVLRCAAVLGDVWREDSRGTSRRRRETAGGLSDCRCRSV